MTVDYCKNKENNKLLEFQVVFQSWKVGTYQISFRSDSNFLDVHVLDPYLHSVFHLQIMQ